MAVIRGDDEDVPYVRIRNSTARDSNLSYEARGMLVQILSHSPGWKIREKELMKAGNTGRDRVRRMLSELEKAGYALRVKPRDPATGLFGETDWHIYGNPRTGFQAVEPLTGNPSPDIQATVETRINRPRPDYPSPDYPSPENPTHKNNNLKETKKELTLPDWLDGDAWSEWVGYRKELKKPLKPTTVTKQIGFLANHVPDHKAILERSMTNGWTGLFPLDNRPGQPAGNAVGWDDL